MRNSFASELTAIASENDKVVLLSGDIGNRLFDDYKKKFPNRFYNCGVAEANMTGVAAGMALSGLHPITYTITPFATTRCLEQIRVDLCYHNLPAVIVGVGAGLSYAGLGATHHSCEDIALMRALPNMTVICPGDAIEVRHSLREALKLKGPVYIRLGKKGEPLIHKQNVEFTLGKAISIREGDDVCLLATGNILPLAAEVGDRLAAGGISTRVLSCHTVKPLDIEILTEVFEQYPLVVTLEEHSLIGGFGSAVAEWLVDQPVRKARLLRLGTRDEFCHHAGGQNYARKYFSLSVEDILQKILNLYQIDNARKHIPC
ncbi:MAG: transketolase [Chlamydiales bacterium]|jgi:transketolase